MKAIQIVERNKAVWVEADKPRLKSGYVLAKPVILSLCASDIHRLRYEEDSFYPSQVGSSGHEVIARIEAIPEGEESLCPLKVGDVALMIEPPQLAMAEYFLAEYKNIIPLPEGVAYEELVQAQQLGTVMYACQRLPNLEGKTVAIVGQGSAGIWFNTMTKKLGAKKIIAIDLQKHRLEFSPLYGATHTIHNADGDAVELLKELNDGDLADVVIEASGEVIAINLAVNLAKDYGFMLMFGVAHQERFVFDYDLVFRKNLTLQACVYASREPNHASTRQALAMIASGEVNPKLILTHRFKFADVLDAYELQRSKNKGALKIVIEMPT